MGLCLGLHIWVVCVSVYVCVYIFIYISVFLYNICAFGCRPVYIWDDSSCICGPMCRPMCGHMCGPVCARPNVPVGGFVSEPLGMCGHVHVCVGLPVSLCVDLCVSVWAGLHHALQL